MAAVIDMIPLHFGALHRNLHQEIVLSAASATPTLLHWCTILLILLQSMLRVSALRLGFTRRADQIDHLQTDHLQIYHLQVDHLDHLEPNLPF